MAEITLDQLKTDIYEKSRGFGYRLVYYSFRVPPHSILKYFWNIPTNIVIGVKQIRVLTDTLGKFKFTYYIDGKEFTHDHIVDEGETELTIPDYMWGENYMEFMWHNTDPEYWHWVKVTLYLKIVPAGEYTKLESEVTK